MFMDGCTPNTLQVLNAAQLHPGHMKKKFHSVVKFPVFRLKRAFVSVPCPAVDNLLFHGLD